MADHARSADADSGAIRHKDDVATMSAPIERLLPAVPAPAAPGTNDLAALAALADALASVSGANSGFEALADRLPLFVLRLDREGRIRWLNSVLAERIGSRAANLIGRPWPSFFTVSLERSKVYARVLEGEAVPVPGLELSLAGRSYQLDVEYRPARGADGCIDGILIVAENCVHARSGPASPIERRFEMLAECARDVLAVVTAEGLVTYVNGAVRDLMDQEPETLIGRQAFDFVHPDDVAPVAERLGSLVAGSPAVSAAPLEYRVLHRDGSWRWVETALAPLEDAGRDDRVFAVVRDVHERRLMREALRVSEERHRIATQAMNGVICEWDLATGRVERTHGMASWLGGNEEAMPATLEDWLARIHPDDRADCAIVPQQLDVTEPFESAYRMRTEAGDYASLWQRSIIVRDAGGRPQRILGFIVNRTTDSRMRAMLETTERTAKIGGWEQCFVTGRIYWTAQVYELHDLAADGDALEPASTRRFLPQQSQPVIDAAIEAARRDGRPFDIETEMVSATGRSWWARIVGEVERDAGNTPIRVFGAIQDITERKQADLELRTKTHWLEIALATARMSAWNLELATGCISTAVRSATLRHMIRPPTSLSDLYANIHPDDRGEVTAALERAVKGDDDFQVEYRTRMLDGRWAWKSSVARVQRDTDGSAVALTGGTQDVTERKRAELALRESERMLRQVTETSTDYLTLVDRHLLIRFTNRRIGTVSTHEAEGLPIAQFIPAAAVPRALACMRHVLATGRPDRYSLELPAVSGRLRHFEFRVGPVTDGDRIVGLVINGSDVTEHIIAERAIATQAMMLESMLEGVAVIDDVQRIEITNPAFDRMFGYSRGGLTGMDIAVISAAADDERDRWLEHLSSKLADSEALPVEFEGLRQDESTFAVAGILTRFNVAGREHRLAVLHDVSERKALEREILEASNREQQRIGADLHDGLGQELTGIALMLRSVAGRLATDCPHLLPEVDSITRLVSGAVESTRALARGLSPVTLERRGLLDALESLAMRARDTYGIDVDFRASLPVDVELESTLADHLYRIAQEALTNAMRHGRASAIRIRLAARDGRVRLEVADNGTGLPQGALDAPGIGLKIMQYRASIVRGEVRFERNGRQGTRVVCECPLAASGHSSTRPKRPGVRRRTHLGRLRRTQRRNEE
jgi:two-component system, LuxR family, sensor kinase FixL